MNQPAVMQFDVLSQQADVFISMKQNETLFEARLSPTGTR